MEDLGGEVVAEEPPPGAIGCGADAVLVAAHDYVCGQRWAVRKHGTILN